MVYKFVFRIRTRYFDQIVANTKKTEYRRDVPFWQIRILHATRLCDCLVSADTVVFKDGSQQLAVFICGKRKHVRQLISIVRMPTPDYFSEQGKKDVNTPICLGFNLGAEVA
jgi:hypothetical protein